MLKVYPQAEATVLSNEPTIFPLEQRSAQVKWDRLKAHLEENYFEPDLEALRACAAAAAAHVLYPSAAPVWLMVLGAPGSGKTSQIMPVLRAFPRFKLLDQITPSTFLSGWISEKKETSLLRQLGSQIIFGVSDFSGIRSLGGEKLAEVASQLRAIYDGHIEKKYGVSDKIVEWTGKATMIVCSTSDVERQWSMQRSLGERFLYLRWKMGKGEDLALMAGEQEDLEGMKERTTDLTVQWILGYDMWDQGSLPKREEMIRLGFHTVAGLVAQLRRPVAREGGEVSEVIGGGESEGPGRIIQTMYNCARAHAALFRRPQLTEEDVKVAFRIARESVPLGRMRLLDLLMEGDKWAKSKADLMTELEKRGDFTQSASTLERQLAEMAAVGAVKASESGGQRWFEVREDVRERYKVMKGGE